MNRLRVTLGVSAFVVALVVPLTGPAAAQQVPPLPPAPGLPTPVPPSSTAAGAEMSPDLALEVLTTATQDPTAIDVASDGRVVFAERQGAIKVITIDGDVVEAGRILTSAALCVGCPDETLEEGGVHGLELAPDFATTGRFYVYYSIPYSVGTAGFGPREGAFRLSTFVLRADNTIDPESEVELLRNPAEWFTCCHYGGDIDFLPDGTLLLSVGDDTSPRVEGWNPRDERPGQEAYNADRTAQNPADRRGKVLRMMPDGSVPDGTQPGIAPNPHVDDPAFDPYVYAMGLRSDYRIAVDEQTGFVFVGNVGPDAAADDPNRGPRGYDELETIPAGGGTNHGWPRCIGDNKPYMDYDYATLTSSGPLSCDGMVPATIYYPYGQSAEFPELDVVGANGRTAIAGVVYRYDGTGPNRLPDAYQGSLLFMEWSRDVIWSIPVKDGDGADVGHLDTTQITRIASKLFHPIDAEVGPDGAVYLAEYGRGFYLTRNARISRIVPAPADGTPATAASGTTAQPMTAAVLGVLAAALLGPQLRRRTLAR